MNEMGSMAGNAGGAEQWRATPVMAQYLEIKKAHPGSLLFYRMGDFYELFFADAEVAARDLGIALTKRGKHLGEDIPMCGVPVHAADGYLQRLIRLGHRVAVCEQLEDPEEARKRGSKSVVRRDVVRLVTPGTLTEDTLLEARANNFLASLARVRGSGDVALAWTDISSGELAVQGTAPPRLAADLARVAPREIVVPDSLLDEEPYATILRQSGVAVTPLPAIRFDSASAERRLKEHFGVLALEAFGSFGKAELACLGGLLEYITLTQVGRSPFLRPPRREGENGFLLIDPATRANLEISRSLSGSAQGSLLATIDMTVTASGARLLAERLAMPLADALAINRRLDEVSFFSQHGALRQRLREALRGAPDVERALARLTLGRGGPRDLAAVRGSLACAADLARHLREDLGLDGLPVNIALSCRDLAEADGALGATLGAALADDLPLAARDGGFVRPGYLAELDQCRSLRDETRQVIAGLQARYADETSVKSLKIRHNNVLGYFIEVTAPNAAALHSSSRQGLFIHRQTVANAMRFVTAELSSLEQRIATAADRAVALELGVFEDLTAKVEEQRQAISSVALAISAIDVAAGLAELAERRRYARPKVDQSLAFEVKAGRHPVVEAALQDRADGSFIANDCGLSGDGRRLWLLTGPNMAGKSTFLRQNALLVILAQMGSFVPAGEAHIGVVDRLFSRVGAADDLARGRSTFMVEMVETAAILNQASQRSFVILDEIGRGTATFDGLSIAWATVEHLHEVNRCRAIFATHYHELTALAGKLDHLANATVKVREWQGDVIFLHEVAPGVADRSFGIQVARLAGLPAAVVGRATEVLEKLERGEDAAARAALIDDLPLFTAARQAPLPRPSESGAERRLRETSPDELSPREALTLLYELKALLPEVQVMMNAKSDRLVDIGALRAELGRIAGEHRGAPALRPSIVKHLKALLQDIRKEAEVLLLRDGQGTRCSERLSLAEDDIIRALHDLAAGTLFPPKEGSAGEAISVIAVGGYGRGTLAPGSDIDLLFLLPDRQSERVRNITEFILYTLWDMRQKVGHATRSIEECIRLARTDSTILTAILEARYICGDRALYSQLLSEFRGQIVARGAREFVAGKLAERDLRHHKAGESRYLVEPDVKDGKGGLRDLNTLFWIAKFLFATNSTGELAEKGAFSRDEIAVFKKCENFLWAVRCHLHFASGRGNDRLSFDRQPDIAERLGYKAHGGLKHVERFMKHYFLVAKDVGDLTRILCASLEARQVKDVPTLARMFGRFRGRVTANLADAPGFRLDGGRIALVEADAFARDPVNLIRLFAVAGRHGAEIHPDALKQARKSLTLIREDLRRDPQANAIFLEMLTQTTDPETILRMMNEAGVLGRFIPEFGKIVAMMQFNMYHHYTVDEHLIRAVGVLASIARGELSEDHPLSASIFPTIANRRALFVAVLLHDIAKGRKEDHSVAGERIALELCPRLGLSAGETETVAWLVRHHLLMSETAQMRDLNDFKTILDFAAVVQSLERLKLLLILTVADIRAVGPGVWNGWKGQLLRTLYAEAEPVLSGGHTAVTRKERVKEAQETFLAAFPEWSEDERRAHAARHYDAYWLSVPLAKQIKHQKLIASAPPKAVVTAAETDAFTAITELTVYAPDHPRLLALITGACAAAAANIAGAQIFTTTDGMALDTILIQREFADEDDERRRAGRVADLIRKALRGELWLREAVARAYRPRQRIGAFTVEPRVIIDNQSSNRFTVIEINGLDRIGLLYDLTEALYKLNLNIASAHVTTFGEKAIDVFYVTDLTGGRIESESRRKQIENALAGVLVPPAAAALSA